MNAELRLAYEMKELCLHLIGELALMSYANDKKTQCRWQRQSLRPEIGKRLRRQNVAPAKIVSLVPSSS